jgi:hypothetical protein
MVKKNDLVVYKGLNHPNGAPDLEIGTIGYVKDTYGGAVNGDHTFLIKFLEIKDPVKLKEYKSYEGSFYFDDRNFDIITDGRN